VPLAVEATQSEGRSAGHLLFSSVGDRLGATAAPRPSTAGKNQTLPQPRTHGGSIAPTACRFSLGPNGSSVPGGSPPQGRSRAMSHLQVRTLTDATIPCWDQFVESSSVATFFHRAAWKGILERSFGHRTYFCYAEEKGEVRGVLPLVHVKSRLF